MLDSDGYNALVKRKLLSAGLPLAAVTLLALLLATSCGDSPTPEAVETAPAVDAILPTQVVVDSPVPASPTTHALPTAEFRGVNMTYDEALLGRLKESGMEPPEAPDAHLLAQPAHIAFAFDGSDEVGAGELLVVSVAEYKKIAELAPAHINNLEEILAEKPVQPNSPLLLFPTSAIAEDFLTEPDYVEFDDGLGIAFVTKPSDEDQDQPLYAFQGLTRDETHLVTLLVPLLVTWNDGFAATDLEGELSPVGDREDAVQATILATQEALGGLLTSLEIQPAETLLPTGQPAYLAYSGVLLGYEPDVVGAAAAEKKPPIYVEEDGTAVFMEDVPDSIHVLFGQDGEEKSVTTLAIQRVKGATGQFYQAVPLELQQKVTTLENEMADLSMEDETAGGKNFERTLHFSSGQGERWVQEINLPAENGNSEAQSQNVYRFEGITDDGQYFVRLTHPLQFSGVIDDTLLSSGSRESGLFFTHLGQLDEMMQSLVINAEASTESSMPENDADCVNEAQFIDDVTVQDQAVIEAGHAFEKVWRIRNIGTCVWTPAYNLSFVGGNPLEWGNARLLEIVAPGEETEVSAEIVSPEVPGLYEAWWQLVDEQGKTFGPNYRVLFESPRPATDIPGYGVIQGSLGYPASGMPAMTIYFLRTDDSQRFALETEEGWVHYVNEVPAGEYYVFARVSGDESDSGGGFTEAVLCGMTCDDHKLVPVTIQEGKATENVDILDWYAPAGTFPLP